MRTVCVLPASSASMRVASERSRGFPNEISPTVTTVSAATIAQPSERVPPARAFILATRMTWSAGASPGSGVSSTLGAATSTLSPRRDSSSSRRGEADARMRRISRPLIPGPAGAP